MLKPRVQTLCGTIDAFVCVLDASACFDPSTRQQRLAEYRTEIALLLDSRWSKPSAPLLLLACTAERGQQGISCAEVARELVLGAMSRPWQVRGLCLQNYAEPMLSGVRWLADVV